MRGKRSASAPPGLLVLPHYLVEADAEGISRHVAAICKSVKIGVIVYNRNVCRLGPDALEKLAAQCPNLIGFKDGIGDLELMVAVRRRMGDRFAYLGGLPTAEFFAAPYKAMGVPVYSSAVFNFIPKTAMQFYRAIAADDAATANRLLDEFFMPYSAIRNRRAGYAVSIVKAGVDLVGRSAGPVRTPLLDCTRGGADGAEGADRQARPAITGGERMQRVLLTGASGGVGARLRTLLPPHLSAAAPQRPQGAARICVPDEEFVAADLADMAEVERRSTAWTASSISAPIRSRGRGTPSCNPTSSAPTICSRRRGARA